jgi:hypothetical protein
MDHSSSNLESIKTLSCSVSRGILTEVFCFCYSFRCVPFYGIHCSIIDLLEFQSYKLIEL